MPGLRSRRACADCRALVTAAAKSVAAHGCLFDWIIRVSNLWTRALWPGPGPARWPTARGWAVGAASWLLTAQAIVARRVAGMRPNMCACRSTVATANFKLQPSEWGWLDSAARAGNCPALLCLVPCRSPTPVHCGCPPSMPRCRVCAANHPAATACGHHPSQLSLLHRPRLLVSLTCPKPGPNRHCAMAGATLFGQVGHYSLSGGQGAICN